MIRALHTLSLFIPAVLLIVLAGPRFFTGLALEEVYPVPDGIVTNRYFAPATYADAASFLSLTDAADGDSQATRAAALWHSGEHVVPIGPILVAALSRSPSSIQGWVLLAESLETADRKRAATALSVGLELSPFDYWLVGRKARAAAVLWSDLDSDARQQATAQAAMLWTEEDLRPQIVPLVSVKGGAALLTRAITDPDQIRAINRYISKVRLGLP